MTGFEEGDEATPVQSLFNLILVTSSLCGRSLSDWVSGPATVDRFSCEPKQGLWPRAYRQVMLRCGKILTFKRN